MVRLSPEKGHWGARGGGSGSPVLADECQSSPSHSSSALPHPDSPLEGWGVVVMGAAPPRQLQLKVKLLNQGWGEVGWVHGGGCSLHLPTPRTPLATRVPFG